MVGGMELWKLPPNEETAMVRSQQSMSQVFLAFGNTSISILPILGFE